LREAGLTVVVTHTLGDFLRRIPECHWLATVDLLLDLNAERWLKAIDPATLTVSPAVFTEAFQVVVRR